jgi:hypothetical protein
VNHIQQTLVVVWLLYTLSGLILGLVQSTKRNNAYGFSYAYFPYGAFVWGDAAMFGLFWTITSLIVLYINNWIFFALCFCAFWLVRSCGETLYWFLQQFTPSRPGNEPKNMIGYRLFPTGDAIWYIYQTLTQCVAIVSLISTIYFAALWVKTL